MSIWLVLAHATQANVYDISKKNISVQDTLIKSLSHAEGRLKNIELASDKAGDYGTIEGGNAALTKSHSPHEMELNYFMEQLAHYLQHECAEHHFDKLVVVMDAHLYGIFEQHVAKEVQKHIVKYVPKNYLTLPEPELAQVITEFQRDFY